MATILKRRRPARALVIPRKQEEDAVDLSVGTTFDRMSKEDLSEHAKTGWITYFEDESSSLDLPSTSLTNCRTAPTEIAQSRIHSGVIWKDSSSSFSPRRCGYP